MYLVKLDEKVKELLTGLPEELYSSVLEKVTFYKTKIPSFSAEEILTEAENLIRLEMLAYLDRRKYLGMYNRQWAEHKIGEYIRKVVASPSKEEKDLYTLGRINFDLNGLKALNDLGGHAAGNKGLMLFANILNFGATTLWLRDELGIIVITSAEGGDEFGIVITGEIDLREHIGEIAYRYFEEVFTAPASELINFRDEHVRENLKMLGIADNVREDYQFKLSTSVGAALLGEAINKVDVNRENVTFSQMITDISNTLFSLADKRAGAHKSKFKRQLSDSDPILSGLYARMSKEVIHLERELRATRDRIRELEARVKEE